MMDNTTAAPAAMKTKSVKIALTIPVSVEYYGKNEKGFYEAKILGFKDKDGNALSYMAKDKDTLQTKIEKGATTAAKYFYASSMQSCNGYGACHN